MDPGIKKNLVAFDLDYTLIDGYLGDTEKEMKISPDVCAKLYELKEIADLAIVSASESDIYKMLESSGCIGVFKYVYSRNEDNPSKLAKLSQPEQKAIKNNTTQLIARQKAKTLESFTEKGYKIEDMYFVDDSDANVEAARDLGIKSIKKEPMKDTIISDIELINNTIINERRNEIVDMIIKPKTEETKIPVGRNTRAMSLQPESMNEFAKTLEFESACTPPPSALRALDLCVFTNTPTPPNRALNFDSVLTPPSGPLRRSRSRSMRNLGVMEDAPPSCDGVDELDKLMSNMFLNSPPKQSNKRRMSAPNLSTTESKKGNKRPRSVVYTSDKISKDVVSELKRRKTEEDDESM
jgi:hypothetical protein